jgi:voltage-gated sodium channel
MLKRLLLNDKFILILILANAVTIFIRGFEVSPETSLVLLVTDNIITGLFIFELIVKFSEYGVKVYFQSNWRKFDFILIVLSIPALVAFIWKIEVTNFSFILIFRVLRVFKSFRFLKFIPGVENLIQGIRRALKASIVVMIGFVIYIFIIGIFSFYLFKEISPLYFSNPAISLYSTFKIFTIEGWYEIPENLSQNLSPITAFFTYLYFIFVVISGGIFGLSLVNSIFVDAMVSDNNDELEKKIESLSLKIDILLSKNNKS